MPSVTESTALLLSASQIEDLRLASSKMTGVERRSFQAAMALKYCGGNARQAERVFGWNRDTVELGLQEHRGGKQRGAHPVPQTHSLTHKFRTELSL